jgi:hypothetical protein
MRRFLLVAPATAFFALGPAGRALADNPSVRPGRRASPARLSSRTRRAIRLTVRARPSMNPDQQHQWGVGGQHYSENSQHDVACFQASQH